MCWSVWGCCLKEMSTALLENNKPNVLIVINSKLKIRDFKYRI